MALSLRHHLLCTAWTEAVSEAVVHVFVHPDDVDYFSSCSGDFSNPPRQDDKKARSIARRACQNLTNRLIKRITDLSSRGERVYVLWDHGPGVRRKDFDFGSQRSLDLIAAIRKTKATKIMMGRKFEETAKRIAEEMKSAGLTQVSLAGIWGDEEHGCVTAMREELKKLGLKVEVDREHTAFNSDIGENGHTNRFDQGTEEAL